MNHGISDQEWNDYIDGIAAAEVCNRIQSHCAVCEECWEFHEQISCSALLLQEAGNEARLFFTLKESHVDQLLTNVLAAIRDESGSLDHFYVKGRLDMLETVFAPFCGSQTAVRVLRSAAAQSRARTLEQITEDNWEPFLERLTAIAAAMVGDTFANLVWEQGRL
jgi:hypothetical protein